MSVTHLTALDGRDKLWRSAQECWECVSATEHSSNRCAALGSKMVVTNNNELYVSNFLSKCQIFLPGVIKCEGQVNNLDLIIPCGHRLQKYPTRGWAERWLS